MAVWCRWSGAGKLLLLLRVEAVFVELAFVFAAACVFRTVILLDDIVILWGLSWSSRAVGAACGLALLALLLRRAAASLTALPWLLLLVLRLCCIGILCRLVRFMALKCCIPVLVLLLLL